MTTRQMVQTYRVCEMCAGLGRIDHGGVDATCPRPQWGGCHGTGLMFCPECRREHIRVGEATCRTCQQDAAA